MYQRVGTSAYKADLNNTLQLIAHLEEPQKHFKTVHVAGTNGKGSCSHMLASVLQEAGYKTGLYTSPHLKDFRERIKINGQMISKKAVVNFVEEHQAFFKAHQLSFFEMTVGLAFQYFKEKKVDIAIIEVGLGGRLDSTNVILPEVSVITNIGLDHTKFLGTTYKAIASEKAGIIKPNIPVVIGEKQKETVLVFKEIASAQKAPLYFAEEMVDDVSYVSDLLGNYQKKNIKTVVATLTLLQQQGWKIEDFHIKNGLLNTIKNTGLMGRWHVLQQKPKVVCDTAHNKEGLEIVLAQLHQEAFNHLHMVVGFVDDKDLGTVLPLFPEKATYYFCRPDVPRGLAVETLGAIATTYNLHGNLYASVNEAFTAALNSATPEDFIYVGGSTFVVAEVL